MEQGEVIEKVYYFYAWPSPVWRSTCTWSQLGEDISHLFGLC